MIKNIFIVGNSRSGTTLLSKILSKHSKVQILNECHFVDCFPSLCNNIDKKLTKTEGIKILNKLFIIQKYGYYNKDIIDDFRIEINQILETINEINFKNIMQSFFKYKRNEYDVLIIGDQTPRNIFFYNQIDKIFENSIFINLIRDPRAINLSQKNKWKASKRLNQPFLEIVRAYFNYHPITTTLIWKKAILISKKYSKNENFFNIKFENMIKNPEQHIKKICEYLKIEWEETMLEIHSNDSSNSDKDMIGINNKINNKWMRNLNLSEIKIIEFLSFREILNNNYNLYNSKFTILFVFSIIYQLILFPIHLVLALAINLYFIYNPIVFIKKILKA